MSSMKIAVCKPGLAKARLRSEAHQPVQGIVFHRWQDDWWALQHKPAILNRIAAKATE